MLMYCLILITNCRLNLIIHCTSKQSLHKAGIPSTNKIKTQLLDTKASYKMAS